MRLSRTNKLRGPKTYISTTLWYHAESMQKMTFKCLELPLELIIEAAKEMRKPSHLFLYLY